ncbi:hypothetical protein K504DRAFT_452867 [Pleomassaria siparia CBS 279.74]|uniref:Uncharacterized protein n=1 Tax=Pleomassaria siparia CBS 279.74 TaxID=1314801 RepID=A0A6G1KIH9_9PLEO|nr:hypothetical protein K504DRAFT_452867 [Pleomassaria siparia CBS 279.74]
MAPFCTWFAASRNGGVAALKPAHAASFSFVKRTPIALVNYPLANQLESALHFCIRDSWVTAASVSRLRYLSIDQTWYVQQDAGDHTREEWWINRVTRRLYRHI